MFYRFKQRKTKPASEEKESKQRRTVKMKKANKKQPKSCENDCFFVHKAPKMVGMKHSPKAKQDLNLRHLAPKKIPECKIHKSALK